MYQTLAIKYEIATIKLHTLAKMDVALTNDFSRYLIILANRKRGNLPLDNRSLEVNLLAAAEMLILFLTIA